MPAPYTPLYDDRVAIQTPEHVAFAFEIAGIGSRTLAYIIDWLLRFVLGALFVFALDRLAPVREWLPERFQQYEVIILLSIWVALMTLYMPIFEAAWEGQTPGKRATGIRVVRDDGTPIAILDAILRNVMRIVDFLPFMYGLGLTVMFLNRQSKRIGDFVAGTIVVKERRFTLDQYLTMDRIAARTQEQAGTADAAAPAAVLSAQEYELLGRYLERRGDFDADTRAGLAAKLAASYREAPDLHGLSGRYQDNEAFLEALVERGATSATRAAEPAPGRTGSLTAPQTLDRFVEAKRARWAELDRAVDEIGRRGLRAFGHETLAEIGHLYRAVSADYALAHTYYPGAAVTAYLNRLVAAGHNRIYRRPGWTWRTLLDFYLVDVPRTFQQYQRYFWISAAAFLGTAFAAFGLVLHRPEFADLVVSPRLMHYIERQEMWTEDLWLNAPAILISVAILHNNIMVTAMTFAMGVFFGLGTLYYLTLNGFLLGTISALTWRHGMARDFWDFVTPHGVIEISMILIGGMGGLILGNCLLSPGRYTRRDAFRLHGRAAVRLMLASVPVLICAGWIEGNFSPAPFPFWFKQAFGLLLGVVLFGYLLGHSPRREEPWGPGEPDAGPTAGRAP